MKIVENQASSPMSSECVQESISIDNEIRSRNQVTDQLINDAVGEVVFSNVSPLIYCIELFKSEPKWLNAQRSRALLKQTPDYCRLEIIDAIFPYDATPSHLAEKTLNKLKRYMGADKSGVLVFEEIRTNLTALYYLLRDAQAFVESLDLDEAERCLTDIQAMKTMDRCEIQTFPVASVNFTTTASNTIGADAQLNTREVAIEVDIEKMLKAYRLECQNKNLGMKEIDQNIKTCQNIHELIGKSDMNKITRDDVNQIIPDLKLIPSNPNNDRLKKHFDGMSLKQIIEKNSLLGFATRKEETSLRDVGRASTIYKWAIKQNKIAYNPFEGFAKSKSKKSRVVRQNGSIDGEKAKKEPFSVSELKKIFSHPVYSQGKVGKRLGKRLNYQYWVMIIALVTGARPNEICQLRVADVRVIDGVECFVIHEGDIRQKVKNDNAVRYVPIPKKLFELGFREYFDSVKSGEMLFPDLTYTESSGFYGKVESWFRNQFTEKMNLTEKNKSFTSLRHNFVFDYQKRGQRCPLVARLVGHENGNITDDTYGGRLPAQLLKEKIDEYDVSEILENVLPFKVE